MGNELDNYVDAYKDSFNYALDNELMLNWYPERILKLARGNSLLELGLGHGYTSLKFSESFSRHLLIEGSEKIIDQFNEKHRNHKIEIIQSYFEAFDTTEKFDVIVMGFILEHVDDPEIILRRFRRFLSPNGSIFITVPNSEALNKRFGFEAGLIENMSMLSKADLDLGHKRLFTVKSLETLVRNQGYSIKETEGIFLKPVTTQQIINLNLSKEILEAMLKVGVNYPELCVAILMQIEAYEQ